MVSIITAVAKLIDESNPESVVNAAVQSEEIKALLRSDAKACTSALHTNSVLT